MTHQFFGVRLRTPSVIDSDLEDESNKNAIYPHDGDSAEPSTFFHQQSIDYDGLEDVANDEGKPEFDSENCLGISAIELRNSGNLTDGDSGMDSVWMQRAFESIKKERDLLQEKLDEERRKLILQKPRFDYLESQYTEYVQKREDYTVKLEKLQIEEKQSARSKPTLETKETQTWKNIICSYCSKTNEIANQKMFRDFVGCQTKNSICISCETYQELEKRFKDLKEAIRQREIIYENRSERAEVINLRATVEHIKLQMEHVMRKNKHGQFCLETLQQIIVKLTNDDDNSDIEGITHIEQQWIDRIKNTFDKHGKKLVQPVSLTPSAIDFTKPNHTMACTESQVDAKTAAGDF